MRLFPIIFLILPFACCVAVSGELPTVNARELESESGVRQILLRVFPTFKPSFYYFDGEQSFGVFLDPSVPTKVLLLVVPDGSVLRGTYKEGGKIENVELKPNSLTAVFLDPETAAPTGESYTSHLGTFVIVPKNGEIHLDLRIRQMLGDWSLHASRLPDGRWIGTMRKSEPEVKSEPEMVPSAD